MRQCVIEWWFHFPSYLPIVFFSGTHYSITEWRRPLRPCREDVVRCRFWDDSVPSWRCQGASPHPEASPSVHQPPQPTRLAPTAAAVPVTDAPVAEDGDSLPPPWTRAASLYSHVITTGRCTAKWLLRHAAIPDNRIIADYRLSQIEAFPLMKCIRWYVLIILILIWRKTIHFWRRFARKSILTGMIKYRIDRIGTHRRRIWPHRHCKTGSGV